MEKDELLFLDDLDLPEEELTKEELEKIKKKTKSILKDYKNAVSKIKGNQLDIESLNKEDIEDYKNEVYIHLAKNTVVLKKLVLEAIDKEINLKGEITYKDLLRPSAMSAETGYWTYGCPFYFYTVFSTEEIIIYKLDNHFRVIESKKYKITDIEDYRVGIKKVDENYIKKQLVLNIKNGKFIDSYYIYNDRNYSEFGLDKLIELLKSLKVKDETETLKAEVKAYNRALTIMNTMVIVGAVILAIVMIWINKL
ncbi:MAG: hypothetical protein ACRDD2_10825 [Sarcina sp.]